VLVIICVGISVGEELIAAIDVKVVEGTGIADKGIGVMVTVNTSFALANTLSLLSSYG
jgi:hypothetical protein